MNAVWQEEWECFVDALESRLQSGESDVAVSEHFGGRRITWAGVLAEKSIDALAPGVTIRLPKRRIDLGSERSAVLERIYLPIARHSIADWKKLEVGTPVVFTATLGAGVSPFLPIQVKHLESNKSVVMIKLTNGIAQPPAKS